MAQFGLCRAGVRLSSNIPRWRCRLMVSLARLVPTLAVVATLSSSVAAAQTPLPVSTSGNSFSPEGGGATLVELADVPGGRRFVGKKQGAEVILRGNVRMPPPAFAEPKAQRLVVHFGTSQSGTSLQSVELRNGTKVEFHVETNLRGDYRARDVSNPESIANAWAFASSPILIGPSAVLRLKVRFASGIDSPVNPGEFVVYDVGIDFARKPIDVAHSSVRSATAQAREPTSVVGSPKPRVEAPAKGVIYTLAENNQLLWYAHTGRDDGTFRWAAPTAKTVGTGWAFRQVFSGGDGIIYAITADGDLLWYRHDGRDNGSFRWAAPEGKKIASGWMFKQVFAGSGAGIYAVTSQGELLWFRHDGRGDGSATWADPKGKRVGSGWTFKQVFSGGDGVIYAVTGAGDLLWFRHDKTEDGTVLWRAADGKKIASGWTYPQVFSGGGGVIYATTTGGELLWFRHDGRADGSPRWAASEGRKVGTGWVVKEIFSGANGGP